MKEVSRLQLQMKAIVAGLVSYRVVYSEMLIVGVYAQRKKNFCLLVFNKYSFFVL